MFQLYRIIQILGRDILKYLVMILARLPSCLGKVHKQTVATVARSSTRNIPLIGSDKGECLLYQRQDFGRCQIALYNEIIAGEATHRAPVYDSVRPHRMITQERCRKMLNCVYCTGTEHRLAVRLLHAHIKGCHHLAAYIVPA